MHVYRRACGAEVAGVSELTRHGRARADWHQCPGSGDRPLYTARVALRTFACRISERYRAELTWLGLLGVVGFVAARLCLHFHACDTPTYVGVVAASLLSLSSSLLIALLGDRYELSRLQARQSMFVPAARVHASVHLTGSGWHRTPRAQTRH